ncbi:MAG: glycosyltransferase family 4 protein [Candidatus Omnitrophica bacterium]|nr:glycosyltransferase family 4 protein [Candidatus Omnitrophota bacterium]
MKIGKIKPDILHLHLEVSTSFAPILKCVSGNSKIAASIYMTRAAAPRWAYPLFCGIKSAVDRYICGTDELTQMGVEESRVCRSLKIPIDIKSILPVESASNPVYGRHNLSRDSIILLSVGRLHPDKQHDLIIQCMPDLIRHNGKFRLVILGEGPERKKIERMISCIGADDYVVLAGFHHDVDNYYSAASIYLRASRNEGTNLSVLRAMAHKLPIIANFNNSPCECIRDRINGRQADFRYKSEVIQAISELISDPESASCYGETALQDVQEYDLEECMEGLQNIYEEITG